MIPARSIRLRNSVLFQVVDIARKRVTIEEAFEFAQINVGRDALVDVIIRAVSCRGNTEGRRKRENTSVCRARHLYRTSTAAGRVAEQRYSSRFFEKGGHKVAAREAYRGKHAVKILIRKVIVFVKHTVKVYVNGIGGRG